MSRRESSSGEVWAATGIDVVLSGLWADHPDTASSLLVRLDAGTHRLEHRGDPQDRAAALYARFVLLRAGGADQDAAHAVGTLREVAHEHRLPRAGALASAARALLDLDGGAVADAAGQTLAACPVALGAPDDDPLVIPLLGAVADSLAALCLFDEHDAVCGRLDEVLASGAAPTAHRTSTTAARARLWARWSVALATRSLLPVAFGEGPANPGTPDRTQLRRAVEHASMIEKSADADPPEWAAHSATTVRALEAVYRDRPSEALRLLPGLDPVRSGGSLHRLGAVAAVRAHARVGSLSAARRLDEQHAEADHASPLALVALAAQARERLWLDTHASADATATLARLSRILTAASRHLMDISGAAAARAARPRTFGGEDGQDTGSRMTLDLELRHLLRTAGAAALPLALVVVDVDDVAAINRDLSPGVGDDVLRRVAAALRGHLRGADRLLRCGDDEFALVLPGTDAEQAGRVAGRVAAEIAGRDWESLAAGLRVSVSTGWADVASLSGRRPDADVADLVRRALASLASQRPTASGADGGTPWPPVARGRRSAGPEPTPRRRAADATATAGRLPPGPPGRRARHAGAEH